MTFLLNFNEKEISIHYNRPDNCWFIYINNNKQMNRIFNDRYLLELHLYFVNLKLDTSIRQNDEIIFTVKKINPNNNVFALQVVQDADFDIVGYNVRNYSKSCITGTTCCTAYSKEELMIKLIVRNLHIGNLIGSIDVPSRKNPPGFFITYYEIKEGIL